MICNRFAFAWPDTIDEAVKLLADAAGRGRMLGGGSVLVPALSAGLDDPGLVIDLRRLRLCLGAAATVPVLKEWPLDGAADQPPSR